MVREGKNEEWQQGATGSKGARITRKGTDEAGHQPLNERATMAMMTHQGTVGLSRVTNASLTHFYS